MTDRPGDLVDPDLALCGGEDALHEITHHYAENIDTRQEQRRSANP